MPNDPFKLHSTGLSDPGTHVERVDISTLDAGTHRDLYFTSRFILASADGEIVVDVADVDPMGEGITPEKPILVQRGINPVRITRIYADASDPLIIDCWR
jgi:hypothetical protein